MADRSFVVEAIFRAQDQLSGVLAAIQSRASSLGTSLSSGSFSAASKNFEAVTARVQGLGQALASGNIVGGIGQIGQLAEASKAVTSSVSEVAGAAEGAEATFATLGTGAVVGAAGLVAVSAALATVTDKFIEAGIQGAAYAAELGAIAERTGLTVEQVSRLSFAASQSHANIEELQTGIRFLSRNLLEAREGSVEAQATFLALGFTAKELANGLVSPHDALLRVASAVANVRDPMEKTGIAVQVFGRGAIGLVPFLDRGGAGIEALERKFDSLDATVKASEAEIGIRFKESLAQLTLQMEKVKVQIGDGVAPSLTKLAGAASDVVAGAEALSEHLGRLGKAAQDLPGVDVAAFFTTMETNALAALPVLGDVINLLETLRAIGKASTPEPFTTLGPGELFGGEKPDDFLARRKAKSESIKAQEAAKAAAAEHAKKIAELRAEYDRLVASVDNLAVSEAAAAKLFDADPEHAKAQLEATNRAINDSLQPRLFKIEVDKDGAIKSVRATQAEIQSFLDGNPNNLTLSPIKPRSQQELGRGPAVIEDTKPLEEVPLLLGKSTEKTLDWQAALEGAGVNIEHLIDELVAAQAALGSIAGTSVEVGEILGASFRGRFDPIKGEIRDVQQAVDNFGNSFDGAFSDAIDKILSGHAAMLKFSTAIDGAFHAMARLAAEIVAAIVKAIILKAIFTALGFAAGGATGGGAPGGGAGPTKIIPIGENTGGVFPQRFSQGGVMQAVQHFAQGGVVRAQKVIHAAAGFIVPGGASHIDTYPAMLAGGEVVLQNVGSRTPLSIIQDVGGQSNRLTEVVERLVSVVVQGGGAGGSSSVGIGQLVVQAMDGDSVARTIRPGGRFFDEWERAAAEGRL